LIDVSVIITSYNHEKYIKSAVESAINQTFENFEIIIIDDASGDDSQIILQNLARDYPIITLLINKSNVGVADSLNKALSAARGRYVAFLGSDDMMHKDRLKFQTDYLNEHPDIIGCATNVQRIDCNGQPLVNQPLHNASLLKQKNFSSFNFYFPAPSAMYRLSKIQDICGFKSGLAVEDLDFWLRLTANEGKLAFMEPCLTQYRVHSESVSTDSVKMFISILSVLKENRKTIPYRKLCLLNYLRYIKREFINLNIHNLFKLTIQFLKNIL
jgi:glycosyltransferase involved in cell wall biosynthesis